MGRKRAVCAFVINKKASYFSLTTIFRAFTKFFLRSIKYYCPLMYYFCNAFLMNIYYSEINNA